MAYLSKNSIDLLTDCDCGPYGACCPATHQHLLADILVNEGLLLKVNRQTFRTTDKGRKAMRRHGVEPIDWR